MRAKSQLRITSGTHSGQYIDTPKTPATQPMGERERMAIFNQIREYLPGAKILDAFAGSAALGITALSESASWVDFLEKSPEAIKTIKQNLNKHEFNKNAAIFRSPNQLTKNSEYDLIFADPPYDNPQYELLPEILEHLKSGGIFVLSHPKSPTAPDLGDTYKLLSDRSYAAAQIKIYQKA